jgi:Ca-activated chloride channel family protein
VFALAPGLDLDEPGLQTMAELTGGQYFRAHSSAALQDIGQTLDRLQPVAQQSLPARLTRELYAWPLAAALLFSLLLVVRVIRPQGMAPYWLRRSRP